MLFSDLGLSESILRAVASEGYTTATPIQAQAIPFALEGRDVLGSAQTGTGKTAAFALPILQRLSEKQLSRSAGVTRARALILCPTRELATQIADGFRAYGKNLNLRHVVIFGGVGQNPQVVALRRTGVDIIVATPGRLLDLMNQGHVDLSAVEILVLDEADRMLDMGFIHDIRRIVGKLPGSRQTMFFSATMPREIRTLADTILREPAVVQVAPTATPIEAITQCVYMVKRENKPELLAHLFKSVPMSRAIVFTRTKHGADRVVKRLHTRGIRAEAIHGNKSQNARQRALDNFKRGKTPLLIATDIAARGIDVDNISHVVNYDLTHEPETYVHRIGRTARAGASGAAVSFCDSDERSNLRAIEKLIRKAIPVETQMPTFGKSSEHESDHDDRDDDRERGGGSSSRDRHSQGDRHAKPARRSGPGRHETAHRERTRSNAQRPSQAPHAAHGSRVTHGSPAKHGAGPSHGSHASKPAHSRSAGGGSRATHGSPGTHGSHGSHGSHASKPTHARSSGGGGGSRATNAAPSKSSGGARPHAASSGVKFTPAAKHAAKPRHPHPVRGARRDR